MPIQARTHPLISFPLHRPRLSVQAHAHSTIDSDLSIAGEGTSEGAKKNTME